jgi:hypothetical protein
VERHRRQGGEADTGDRWVVRIAPYLWATSLAGNATVKGIKSDVDVSFGDILKDLSLAGMLLADVHKGRFGLAVNGVFARVSPVNKVGGVKIKTTGDMFRCRTAFALSLAARSGTPSRATCSPGSTPGSPRALTLEKLKDAKSLLDQLG